jgi:hypothetical protein
MSTGSARPLDAYQLPTQVSESPVANVVDPNYTFLTKLRKEYLPRVDPYDGVHALPRDTAVRYRGG